MKRGKKCNFVNHKKGCVGCVTYQTTCQTKNLNFHAKMINQQSFLPNEFFNFFWIFPFQSKFEFWRQKSTAGSRITNNYSTLNTLAANFLNFHPSFTLLKVRYYDGTKQCSNATGIDDHDVAKNLEEVGRLLLSKWFSRYHRNFLSPTDLLKWLGSFSEWLSIADFFSYCLENWSIHVLQLLPL